ncbi:hypothetical protein T06_5998 [Trichinella sp. T6]|nr:hypothetical protein T06_5998 [Trichinella sp. T6]
MDGHAKRLPRDQRSRQHNSLIGIANSPAVSGLLIGGPNELPAWAADLSSIYRATNERRDSCYSFVPLYIDSPFAAVDGVRSSDYSYPNKTNVYSRGSFCLHSTLHYRLLDNPVFGCPRKPTLYSPLSFCPTSERLAKLYLSISSVQNPNGSYKFGIQSDTSALTFLKGTKSVPYRPVGVDELRDRI